MDRAELYSPHRRSSEHSIQDEVQPSREYDASICHGYRMGQEASWQNTEAVRIHGRGCSDDLLYPEIQEVGSVRISIKEIIPGNLSVEWPADGHKIDETE